MEIGSKLRNLRVKHGLTQKELADRAELSKGFISQVENDLTSPSITTLVDILQCLGTDLKSFFSDDSDKQIVFKKGDFFEAIDDTLCHRIEWIIPNAQKNDMEPVLICLGPEGRSEKYSPSHGETFGYVLRGSVRLHIGKNHYRVKKGESFYFKNEDEYYIKNLAKTDSKVLWVSTPPSF